MALTGFIVDGVCQASSAQALLALQANYPVISNGLYISTTGATFVAPNTFNVTMKTIAVNAATNTLAVKNFSLVQCDPLISLDGGTIFDPVIGAAFWSFAMTFVLGLYLVSRNSAAIISAIKRF